MSFPLKAWIDEHEHLPHDLARSGMPKGMPLVLAALRRPMAPDAPALRQEVARWLGAATRRVFLTHGATEAATLTLFFLAARLRRGARAPRFHAQLPEYPPLLGIAREAGYRPARSPRDADLGIASWPNNPTGAAPERGPWGDSDRAPPALLVDETFREFSGLRSLATRGDETVWTSGSFTKVFGGDDLRVGFVVAPPGSAERFSEFHGLVLDEIPPASISAARAILRDRRRILADVRARLRRNVRVLQEALPVLQAGRAPTVFDRPGIPSTDDLTEDLLRAGVVAAPGRFFGDATGIRLCLTRPTFPADLEAYLRVRSRWAPGHTRN